MEKPRLFISAVTRELGSARQRIANILTRKGYEPVWQDIFGTEPGDLRDMLREKINSCAGLIQITGDAYGAEPAEPHPDFQRCSYTQFEFLYALQQKKKTWLLLAGPDVTRDHPLSALDLPRAPHPDPAAWQSERHQLQRLYKERPEFRQHLRHTAESDLALDLATERLNDELAALRAEWQMWKNTLLANVEKSHEDQKKYAAEQKATLADITKKLDEIKLDRAASGQSFRDLTKADLERLLAEKAEITVHELRRRIAVGEQSPNQMERARALLLKGEFDAALKETAELEKTRTDDLIEILKVKAQAHDGKFQYKDALAARQKIAALTDKEIAPAEWAAAQHMVAVSLHHMGKSREAEPILREVVTTRAVQLGPEHRDTLSSRNNLANALRVQGKYTEAEAELRDVLPAMERVRGPEHRHTLGVRSNLACVLASQGKYSEAEAALRDVVAVQERVLGSDDVNTLTSRDNLAATWRELGKYEQAEELHRAVILVMERVLSPEHPNLLGCQNNLGLALGAQGKNEEAEAEHRAVLAVQERLLGPDHPASLGTRNNLAAALGAQGKNEEAEAQHRAVLAAQKRILGPEHPETLGSWHNLASVLQEHGNSAQAVTEHHAVLSVRKRVLGPEHPETLVSHFNLSLCLGGMGEEKADEGDQRTARAHWREALDHARTVQAAGARAFGPEHPDLPRFERIVATLEAKLKE